MYFPRVSNYCNHKSIRKSNNSWQNYQKCRERLAKIFKMSKKNAPQVPSLKEWKYFKHIPGFGSNVLNYMAKCTSSMMVKLLNFSKLILQTSHLRFFPLYDRELLLRYTRIYYENLHCICIAKFRRQELIGSHFVINVCIDKNDYPFEVYETNRTPLIKENDSMNPKNNLLF